jgi:hypothetical protein
MERGRPRPHPAKMRPRTGAVHHDRRGCSRSITRRRMGPATPRWAPSSALSASRRRYNLAFSPRINADQTARGMAGLRLSSLRPDLRASASHFFVALLVPTAGRSGSPSGISGMSHGKSPPEGRYTLQEKTASLQFRLNQDTWNSKSALPPRPWLSTRVMFLLNAPLTTGAGRNR